MKVTLIFNRSSPTSAVTCGRDLEVAISLAGVQSANDAVDRY